jgi:hypothetical protein
MELKAYDSTLMTFILLSGILFTVLLFLLIRFLIKGKNKKNSSLTT